MTPRRARWAAAALLAPAFLILTSSCSDRGRVPTTGPAAAPPVPRRIVSLSPGTTEILFALGLGDKVVGVTQQCDYPEEARRKPKIGDASTSIESVVQARPDLVVAHTFLNRDAIRSLKALKLRVLSIDPASLESIAATVEKVAEACGADAEGRKIASGMRAALDEMTRAAARGGPRVRVLFAAQGSPIWAAGPNTFVDEMIRLCGGANVAAGIGEGSFNLFSDEAAIAADPDIVLVTDGAAQRHFSKSPGWRNVSAVRKSRVVLVDPDLYLRPGPRLVEGLRQMSGILDSTRLGQ